MIILSGACCPCVAAPVWRIIGLISKQQHNEPLRQYNNTALETLIHLHWENTYPQLK